MNFVTNVTSTIIKNALGYLKVANLTKRNILGGTVHLKPGLVTGKNLIESIYLIRCIKINLAINIQPSLARNPIK